MIKEKIRILGIAPYDGMSSTMEKLAEQRSDLELDVFVGNLKKGVEIAQKNFHRNYDVIISRGGTAEMIGQSTTIPVIEITLSVYDILRALKLAENYSDRYAIIGFPSITSNAHLLCDLLQYDIDIFTIHNEIEVKSQLESLKEDGYKMILCDMITLTTARSLGLNAILITSGHESIESAFDQAIKLYKNCINLKDDNRFLEALLREQSQDILVYDNKEALLFSTLDSVKEEAMYSSIQKEIHETLASGEHKFFKNLDNNLYTFTSKKIYAYNQDLAAFFFTSSNIPMANSKYGITYTTKKEIENQFFNSFYSVTSDTHEIQSTIEQISHTQYPVVIIGETGTGKEHVAGALYAQSINSKNPLITINCSLLTDKGWAFLTNHYNSPLNDNHNTIYFKNLESLPQEKRKHLLSTIVDINLHKRNHLIFSCTCTPDETLSPTSLQYVNTLSCTTVYLPPLRERLDELLPLSSLYISTLNVELDKQIIGLETPALELLKDYNWPYNYTQFKRILRELCIITTTPYIALNHVKALISKENTFSIVEQNTDSSCGISLDKTLNEINQDIIQIVLQKCNHNQSATAKKLGISRTSLWRYLK